MSRLALRFLHFGQDLTGESFIDWNNSHPCPQAWHS